MQNQISSVCSDLPELLWVGCWRRFEVIHHHFHRRLGIAMPNVSALLPRIRPLKCWDHMCWRAGMSIITSRRGGNDSKQRLCVGLAWPALALHPRCHHLMHGVARVVFWTSMRAIP